MVKRCLAILVLLLVPAAWAQSSNVKVFFAETVHSMLPKPVTEGRHSAINSHVNRYHHRLVLSRRTDCQSVKNFRGRQNQDGRATTNDSTSSHPDTST